jgi:TonB family protein
MKLKPHYFFSLRYLVLIVLPVLLAATICNAQTKPAPTPKTISGGILNGKAVLLPKPEYPADTRRAGITGTVKIQVLIDETGMVISATAVSGPESPSLRQVCEAAAMKATFSPTLLSGQPVKVSGVISYNFVGQSNEERLKVFGVSAFLGIARHFTSDWSKLRVPFEEDDLIKDGATDFPEFSAEFTSLTKIDNLTPDKRLEAVDKALASVKAKLDPSGRWQFDAGQELARVIGPLMFLMSAGGEPDLSKIDEPAIKLSLNKIRDLTLSAPADFPPDVLERLKEFAALGTKDIFTTEQNFEDFSKKMMALLETISPEAGK